MIQVAMPTRLYLDSTRMGLLSERAKLAHFDYVRLAATEGCSLYFSRFPRRLFRLAGLLSKLLSGTRRLAGNSGA